jgi:iron complex transport system substrate-binding protein
VKRRELLRVVAGGALAAATLPILPAPWSRIAAAVDAGRAAVPARVISAGGALTEIVYALGAGATLVATDTTSTWPEAATRLPKVGYLRALSAEGLLALRPTLLLATADAGPPAVFDQLRAAGLRVVRSESGHSFDALRRSVAEVGRALGRDDEARQLTQRLSAEWNDVTARVARAPGRPRAMFLLAHAGASVQVSGTGTAADAMIRLAGGRNAVSGFEGYRPLTAESAVQAAPEIIVTTQQGLYATGGLDGLLSRPGLALTPAGRARRVAGPEASFLLGFGPRLPAAARELAAAFGTLG